MEKSDFLAYRALVREVQQLQRQLKILESSLYSPKGQRFSSMPRAASGAGKTMDDAVAVHMRLDAKYREALAEKEARQLAIEEAVLSLPNTSDAPERLVMRLRYIEGHGWPAVIREMEKLGCSERTVYRLHGSALRKLKEI